MRCLIPLSSLTVLLVLAAAPAGAKTAPLLRDGDPAAHGSAIGSVTPVRVKGKQVGVKLSKVAIKDFSTEWTELHSFFTVVAITCRPRKVKGYKRPPDFTSSMKGTRVDQEAAVGGLVSLVVPGVTYRCVAPSTFLRLSFAGVQVKPAFHSVFYTGRVAGSGPNSTG
ncbi:MAG: hypothetical protein V9E83_10580 [Baekduia sp.]